MKKAPTQRKKGVRSEFSSEKKLSAVKDYLRMGSAFACRKHQISRQVLHKWVQIFNARAEIIFQHGSTLRAQRHDQEKIEKLTDRVIDLERKVNESGPTELAGDEGPENQNEYEWADIAPIPPRGLK